MASKSEKQNTQKTDWRSVGAWIIDLVRALRGGPGRFYGYTFAAGMIAITGAPWWAPIAEHVADSIIRQFSGEPNRIGGQNLSQVSPWFIASGGFVICLLSMLGFQKIQIRSLNGHPHSEQAGSSADKDDSVEAAKLNMAADLQSLLEAALKITNLVTKTDYNQIFLISTQSHSKKLVCVAREVATGKQDYRIAAFSGLLGKSIESGRAINVSDTRNWVNYMQAVLETRSELVVPIKIEGRIVGVINSESEIVGHYSSDHKAALLRLADAIGTNLHRVGWRENTEPDRLPWIGNGQVHLSPPKTQTKKSFDCPKCERGFLISLSGHTKASEGTFTRHHSTKQCSNCGEIIVD